MTSEARRDPVTDPLLTPQNSALVVIDYQPSQMQAVASIDHDLLTRNIVSVARLAKTYELPIVLSTVNVANGQGPTIPELREVLSETGSLDSSRKEEEMGDLLFSIAQLARQLGVEPETALRKANDKFTRRFTTMETEVAGSGRTLRQLTLGELEAEWQRAKSE